MNKINEIHPQGSAPHNVPIWKTLLLITTLVVAAIFIVAVNVFIGGALFIAAIFLQAYGGFSPAQSIEGETRGRIAGFVFAWVLCVMLAISLQLVIPHFIEMLASFGSDLPSPTHLATKIYPAALLAPLLVGMVWRFWPDPVKRLRAAAILCWLCNGLIVLMMGSMYLPLLSLGPVG